MLSTQLTSEERRQLLALASELDGLPFVEKGERLRARVRELRSRRRRSLSTVQPTSSPSARRAA